ncbi:MAG: hypothetical protein A3B11_00340 [Candidatus Taylorbacteria bacterium RIFCSPLOWO2_01_FULL_44_26]|uniref:Carboxypeptidase regulatory-like domain-containing protein n=2 Tax=Candidatus Tayloriibacteriota TaxID=1817919 RepID=A0A1G2MJK7_9BACT|nr:MAG: hypothetical protein A3D50_02445 [Candidatus Taylorbacteria bacterium RIFCSPHIGHO2_02_FULL_44_12]OHA31137.1 MAG: hypothetical protein A3B11_00340 [Candidatus Taylorbacteria bacterium RIFCSPLOWO2_01_FULL_44_26]
MKDQKVRTGVGAEFKNKKGFTLVEVIVGSAVFLVIAIGAYNAYVGLFKLVDLGQYRVLAVSLANEQFELARNMPYSDVGVQNSIPVGLIPHQQTLVRGGVTFSVTSTVRNVDLSFDGTIGGVPNDLSPADNKLLEITVSCSDCRGMAPITLSGRVAPKNLETASTNGALFIKVFDANGQPVQGAAVHVVNVATTTTIVIDDITDDGGLLQLVDVPPGTNAYRVTVSKSGYSSDRTYPPGGADNPDPSKPDATVILQQVTQISFAIDRLGSLAFQSLTPTCQAVGDFDFSLTGSKDIGQGVPKYSSNMATNPSGLLDLGSMEWDTYVIDPIDTVYDIVGVNPLNPVTVNPSASQSVQLVLAVKNPRALLVTVKDSVTGLPLSDALVAISEDGVSSTTETTGKGYLNQTDWSGGFGQESFSNPSKYWSDDANIDNTTVAGDIRLKEVFGSYASTGTLESSTFDTGSVSNFYNFVWAPSDQPIAVGPASVRFQFASNATVTATTTWNFKGPDGTSNTFYSVPDSTIWNGHSGDRYARYKAYLATQSATNTPNISDTAFTFTSSCTPPGQTAFTGLSSGTYHMSVYKAGYSLYESDVVVSSDWQEWEVELGH